MKFSSSLLSVLLCSSACLAGGPGVEDNSDTIKPSLRRASSTENLKSLDKTPVLTSRRRSRSNAEFPLRNENKDIITLDDLTPVGPSTDEGDAIFHGIEMLPTHEELIDLAMPWGLNLSKVVHRANLVREDQKQYGNVNDEVATFLLNLGTHAERVPSIYRLNQGLQRTIVELYEEKIRLDEERYQLKKAADGQITPEVRNFMDRIEGISSQMQSELTAADIKPDQFDQVIKLAQPIYKEKERVLEILGPLGLKPRHLNKLPPRSDFEKDLKLRESALRPRQSLRDISLADVTAGLDGIHAHYYEIEKTFPGQPSVSENHGASEIH